ncbi:MAG: T9SS type A sorting domain-containing protein [Flavobacteriales bacterium]|nr:T9SS type A sorting domain-containing protein [Flavobacteriales bacterium]
MKTLYGLTIALMLSITSYSQYQTISDGNWNTPSTWLDGNVPISNSPTTAYDSILISHQVTYANEGVPSTIFVNHKMQISGTGSLTIQAYDTLGTGEGSSSVPRFISQGDIFVEKGGSFSTMIGTPTYDDVILSGTIELADSAYCQFMAYDTVKTSGDITIGQAVDCFFGSVYGMVENAGLINASNEKTTLILSADGAVSNIGEINIGGINTGLAFTTSIDTIVNSGAINVVGSDTVSVLFNGGNEGGIINYGDISGNTMSSVQFNVQESASIINDGIVINHRSVTLNAISSTANPVFKNQSAIEGGNCMFLGDNNSNWTNNGIVIASEFINIVNCNFNGSGNFCSKIAFVTNDCDFSGTLDLCAQGAMGIIHNTSTVGENVTDCLAACDLSSLSITEKMLSDINLFPNPASDKLFVEVHPQHTSYTIQVISVKGQILIDQKGEVNGLSLVDVSELPEGIYICRILGLEHQINKSFVK